MYAQSIGEVSEYELSHPKIYTNASQGLRSVATFLQR